MNTYQFEFKFTDTAQGTVMSPETQDVVEKQLLERFSMIDDFRDFKLTMVKQDDATVIEGTATEITEDETEVKVLN